MIRNEELIKRHQIIETIDVLNSIFSKLSTRSDLCNELDDNICNSKVFLYTKLITDLLNIIIFSKVSNDIRIDCKVVDDEIKFSYETTNFYEKCMLGLSKLMHSDASCVCMDFVCRIDEPSKYLFEKFEDYLKMNQLTNRYSKEGYYYNVIKNDPYITITVYRNGYLD